MLSQPGRRNTSPFPAQKNRSSSRSSRRSKRLGLIIRVKIIPTWDLVECKRDYIRSSANKQAGLCTFIPFGAIRTSTLEASSSHSFYLCQRANGQNRIRTCEGKARRFTVFPRWPLGYLPDKSTRRMSRRGSFSLGELAEDENAFLLKSASLAYSPLRQRLKMESKRGCCRTQPGNGCAGRWRRPVRRSGRTRSCRCRS